MAKRVPIERKLGRWTFRGTLPVIGDAVAGTELQKFEYEVARWIIEHGAASPETFRFLRKVIGMRASDFAKLIDQTEKTVSCWENGKHPFDRPTWSTLASLVLDRIEGHQESEKRLRVLDSPPPSRTAIAI